MCRLPLALCLSLSLAPATPSFAHHSFAAYEPEKTLTLTATVEAIDWSNPHTVLHVLAQADGAAAPAEWTIETSSPSILERFGWKGNSLKRGDRVEVLFNPMRDGSHLGRLHTVTLIGSGKVLRTKLSGP